MTMAGGRCEFLPPAPKFDKYSRHPPRSDFPVVAKKKQEDRSTRRRKPNC